MDILSKKLDELEVEERPIFLPESEDETDVESCLYFVVESGTEHLFYRIPDNQPPPSRGEFLDPVYRLKHENRRSPGCAAVGSIIYVLGGGINHGHDGIFMFKDVYFIDTARPGTSWVKGHHPMMYERRNATVFSVNNKVYVYGGLDLNDCSNRLPVEVYDPANDQWEERCWKGGRKVVDYAVYNKGNQVFLYTTDLKLHTYNLETDHLEPCAYPLDYGYLLAMTVLGNILYMGSYKDDNEGGFELIAYDLNKSFSTVAVTGLDKLMVNRSDYRLPQRVDCIGCDYTLCSGIKLIPIGEKKLAVLWTLRTSAIEVYVNCLKMEIAEELIGPNQVRLAAHSGSFSLHKVAEATSVNHYLQVYSPKRELDAYRAADTKEDEEAGNVK